MTTYFHSVTAKKSTPTQVFTAEDIDDGVAHNSSGVACGNYKRFSLYIAITNNGSPTRVVITPQFRVGSTWYNFKLNQFSALIYVPAIIGSGFEEALEGDCLGADQIRISALGTGCDGSNYFTIDAHIGLF